MTTQHTIESPTEYTLDEKIAALRKLGANARMVQWASNPWFLAWLESLKIRVKKFIEGN